MERSDGTDAIADGSLTVLVVHNRGARRYVDSEYLHRIRYGPDIAHSHQYARQQDHRPTSITLATSDVQAGNAAAQADDAVIADPGSPTDAASYTEMILTDTEPE